MFAERPKTPRLEPPNGARAAAAALLQKLLRGRAAQTAMYDGKTRRAALIAELLLEADAPASASAVRMRPEEMREPDAALDVLVGAAVSSLASALAETNEEVRGAATLLRNSLHPRWQRRAKRCRPCSTFFPILIPMHAHLYFQPNNPR